MSLKEFIFEMEQLEYQTLVLRATLQACMDDIPNLTEEDTEYVLAGVCSGLSDVTKKMKELLEDGFETIQRSDRKKRRKRDARNISTEK